MSYSSEVLADSPLCYLRLGEASGATAADSSGNSHSGTYQNSPTLGAAGLLTGDSNTAVTLNGTNQYVSVPGGAWMVNSDYTVECLVKFTSSATMVLLCWASGSAASNRVLELSNLSNLLNAVFYNTSGSGTNVAATAASNDGLRHHIVIRKSGTTLDLWIDNVQVATATATVRGGASAEFDLGRRNGGTFFTAGTFDEFAIYGSALSNARIGAHYTAATITSISGTASAPLGGLTASASGARTVPGVASAPLGGLAASAAGVRTTTGTANAPLGGLTASATESVPEISGTATAALGGLTASATSTRTTFSTAVAALGALTATAAGVRTDAGTASAPLGALIAAAAGATGSSGVALADLGGLIAAAMGTVIGPVVAPTSDPFDWGFTMLAGNAALIPVEGGLDFHEWGFIMLEPGEAMIGDPA